MQTLHLRLTGLRPLMLHNGQLADPTHAMTRAIKELTRQKNKTDAVHMEIKKLEWLGCLYTDADGRIVVTEDMLLGTGLAGAKSMKKGVQFKAAVLGTEPTYPLLYDGPAEPLALFETGKFIDYRGVVVQRARTMRARPRFDKWSVEVGLMIDDSAINVNEVLASYEYAGRLVGLGDFRPRFGRFSVERLKG
jgi:hypothetical protein